MTFAAPGAVARGHRTGIPQADPAGARGPRGGAVSRSGRVQPRRAGSPSGTAGRGARPGAPSRIVNAREVEEWRNEAYW